MIEAHLQMGGDHALYYNLHLSEVLYTAVSKPNELYKPLEKALRPKLGDEVSFTVNEGELTLNDYVVHPNHRVQAVVMIQKGKIVYETYPGMNPMDLHVWMSPVKSTVGLVIAQMEAEGKIDMSKQVVEYLTRRSSRSPTSAWSATCSRCCRSCRRRWADPQPRPGAGTGPSPARPLPLPAP
jgi:hypothetical protein